MSRDGPRERRRARGSLAASALACVLAGVLGGCRPPAASEASEVLAEFDGGEITLGELERELARRAAAGDGKARGPAAARTAVLRDLAVEEILAGEAGAVDPELETAIAADAERAYESAMRRRLGWSDLALSDDEIRRYYDAHREAFGKPERLRLQHVFLRADEDAQERAAVRARLEEIRGLARAGADFSALAREHSDSADGAAGGWMILERDTPAVPAFTEVVWSLREDEISPVIETPVGFHVARVATRLAAREEPYEEVREKAGRQALAALLREREEEYVRSTGPARNVRRRFERLGGGALTDGTVLFSLSGDDFTVADLLAMLPDAYRAHFYAGYFPHVERLLEREILRRLLVGQALAEGLDREPEIQAEVEAARRRRRSRAELGRRLAERGAALDEEALRRHYERAPLRFESERRRTISLIRLAPEGAESLWSLLRRGEALVAALRGGADFAAAARRESRDLSAAAGGRLAALTDGELAIRVPSRSRGRRILDELDVGEISPAFIGEVYDPEAMRMVPTGVYIVRLEGDEPSHRRPFEDVEGLVRADFLRRDGEGLAAEIEREVLARAGFRVVAPGLPREAR